MQELNRRRTMASSRFDYCHRVLLIFDTYRRVKRTADAKVRGLALRNAGGAALEMHQAALGLAFEKLLMIGPSAGVF
jgi:hypothetical protein